MDLLRWPIVGTLARHRHARLFLQLPLLAVAIAIVVHGLFGPRLAPRNLATVLVWVHYRGLLVLALLAAGNLLCTGCPIVLVRDAGRRVFHPGWRWPRVLRTKWPALLLFAAVLFAYELFDLWSLPRATAWLLLAYFGAALAIDVLFAGASFCKYVCPVGQFNFIAATMSPTELRIRDAATCRGCATVDCLKGTPPATPFSAPARRGCELNLFLPAKVGNLDCTLCLDCVHACPHDNIALATRVPGEELSLVGRRSGIGRLARRADLAALVVVFAFGGIFNAFAMTAPAARVEAAIGAVTGVQREVFTLGAILVAFLAAGPIVLMGIASLATRSLTRIADPIRSIAVQYAYAFVPLGLGIWAAHYLFHLLTGAWTIVPVTQSAVLDVAGAPWLGEPLWTWVGARPGAVFPVQLGLLMLGTGGSIATAVRIGSQATPHAGTRAALPWVVAVGVLAIAAGWILAQPMDMRAVTLPG